MNAFDACPVAIRPMRREDVDALAAWDRHADPRYRVYDVGPLTPEEADALWRALSQPRRVRRPFVAELEGRVVAQLVLREVDSVAGSAELGIMVDPALIGRGLGRRILRSFAGYCKSTGFRRLTLEVASDNERAMRAYRAAGFVARGERVGPPYPGAPPIRIIRMETELSPEASSEPTACRPQ